MTSPLRPLTGAERAILDHLLARPFPGRDEAVRQIETCRVRPNDEPHCASFDFEVQSDVLIPNPNSAAMEQLLPVEAAGSTLTAYRSKSFYFNEAAC